LDEKMAKKPEKISDLLIDRDAAAALSSMSARHFGDTIQPLIPTRNVHGNGRSLRFVLGAVVEGLLEYRLGQQAKEIPVGGADDAWMRRWRRARALTAELEHRRLEGTLIGVEFIRPTLLMFAGQIRQAITAVQQRLPREKGNELVDAVNAAIETAQQMAERDIASIPMAPAADDDGTPKGK
jgi:phage terminase Nu1 subunit (DNA packaging protein)